MINHDTLINDLKGGAALSMGMIGGGAGSFFGPVHRAAMRLSGRWRIVAGVFSSRQEKSIAAGKALGVAADRTYATPEEMAGREKERADGVDAVLVVTPNANHFEACRALLKAGIATICDKPLAANLDEADALAELALRSRAPFGVTYTYAGYPMIREAREIVASGRIGQIRVVQVEYLQEWLSEPVESQGNAQAAWRLDPSRAGLSGALGDIGTHAFQLLEFVTGLEVVSVAAELHSIVPGRRLDDNGFVRLRLANGAVGSLWASQVAVGVTNGLRVRVFGEKGSLDWSQDSVDRLIIAELGRAVTISEREKAYSSRASRSAAWLPAGAPEGYLEALAGFYGRFADAVSEHETGRGFKDFPSIRDGWLGMAFLDAAVRSSAQNGAWVELPVSRQTELR
jgi:predicted dehydrogenase